MKMLESYHFFITLRFRDSGDQESYANFWKILLILVIISIFYVKRTGSDLQNECNLKAESDVVTLLWRVKSFAYLQFW